MTRRGAPAEFFENVVLTYDGEECLTWPFGCHATGYAKMGKSGEQKTVSRILCEKIYGPPPNDDKYEAAHSCGKGHLGCVNKIHLRWATPSENQMDRVVHGTSNRGERQGRHKLTTTDVLQIMSLQYNNTKTELASMFGVSYKVISDVINGKTWGWLTSQEV